MKYKRNIVSHLRENRLHETAHFTNKSKCMFAIYYDLRIIPKHTPASNETLLTICSLKAT